MLYANSSVPLYRQLYRFYRKAIDEGDLSVGEKLPSERDIAADYGISRITVRKAMALLTQEGCVQAFQGRGAFVSRSVPHSYAHTDVRGFSEIVRARGMVPTSRVLSCGVVRVSGDVAHGLDIKEYDEAIKVRRLRLANGVPMALDTAYLSYPLCNVVLDANLEKYSLYWTLQEMAQIRLDHADQSLQSVLTSDADIHLLRLEPPTAVVQLKRQTYDATGQIVEYMEAIYQRNLVDLEVFAGVSTG